MKNEISNEELLDKAEAKLYAANKSDDFLVEQAMATASIAASLLVIAREMSTKTDSSETLDSYEGYPGLWKALIIAGSFEEAVKYEKKETEEAFKSLEDLQKLQETTQMYVNNIKEPKDMLGYVWIDRIIFTGTWNQLPNADKLVETARSIKTLHGIHGLPPEDKPNSPTPDLLPPDKN